MNDFLYNLSLVLAHTQLLESKGDEPLGEAWASNFITGLFTSAPEVPKFKPVVPGAEAAKATAANIANFQEISKVASATNQFNQDQVNQMMASAIPGYESMKSGIGSNINSWLKGEIPADVQGQIGRNAAYSSLSGGFAGSEMARNLVARDLGLTSLDIMQKGVDAGSRWLETAKRTAVAPQFDVTSMFVSPQQQMDAATYNSQGKFQRNWMKNQLDQEYSLAGRFDSSIKDTFESL